MTTRTKGRTGILFAALATLASCTGTSDFVAACIASTNMEKPMCECAGEKAKAELTPDGYALLLAILKKDEAAISGLREKVGMQESIKASVFMLQAPVRCAIAKAVE